MIGRQSGIVYIIHAEGTSLYKIGITSRDVEARLRQLQTASPHALYVLDSAELNHARSAELSLHIAFDQYRAEGEWFSLPPRALNLLRDLILCSHLINRYKSLSAMEQDVSRYFGEMADRDREIHEEPEDTYGDDESRDPEERRSLHYLALDIQLRQQRTMPAVTRPQTNELE